MKEKWWEEKIERMEQMVKEKQGELFEKILRKLSKETECKCKCKEIRSEEEIQTRRELEICREGIEKRERIIEEKNEEIEKLKKLVRYGIMRQEELTRRKKKKQRKWRMKWKKKKSKGELAHTIRSGKIQKVGGSNDAPRGKVKNENRKEEDNINKKRTNKNRVQQCKRKKNNMGKQKNYEGTGIWIMDEKTRREREVEIWIRKVARWEQSNGKEVEIKEKRLKIGDIWRSWNETKGEMME
ncbi:uncharacterized protein LOC141531938 [Cotesia typhae]|uniref:uncharacterized protein LOC141531938 n=1 Tax=Cotesia typhae TaxID=2053667 RepID=UPI003D69CD61